MPQDYRSTTEPFPDAAASFRGATALLGRSEPLVRTRRAEPGAIAATDDVHDVSDRHRTHAMSWRRHIGNAAPGVGCGIVLFCVRKHSRILAAEHVELAA